MAKDRRAGPRGLRGALAALLCIGLSTSAMAWDRPQWVRQLGTSEWDFSWGVATDAGGNVYISGHTEGSLGGANAGDYDAWLAKYSATGALLWTRQLATSSRDSSEGVATDGEGNVYISGYTDGSLGGANAGDYDAWLAKYSATGALLWTRQLGTSGGDFSNGVATDGEGNVYISGDTEGSLGGANRGNVDAWAAKYSSDGTLLWTRQLGTSDYDRLQAVATDSEGNVYITGWTLGPLGGANAGDFDAWVAKYSADGVLRWTKQLGTSSRDSSEGVATDGKGNIYISGYTEGCLGGPTPAPGQSDAFIAKYSTDGALRWTRQLGISAWDSSEGIATDGDGNVYLSGRTIDAIRGNSDAFVAKYSAGGALRWTRQLGKSAGDQSSGVATDGDGNVYVSGSTNGALGGANQGGWDAFVAKYFTRR